MSINGISAGYYPTAYANTNIPKGTETASFGRWCEPDFRNRTKALCVSRTNCSQS